MYRNLFFIILFFVHPTYGQIHQIIPGTYSVAHTSVSDSKNYAAFDNPAHISHSNSIQSAVRYENDFFLPALSHRSLYTILPTRYVNTVVSSSFYGFSNYNEFMVGIGLGKSFGNSFSFGLQYNYISTSIADHTENESCFFPQIGFQTKFTNQFQLGCSLFNPFPSFYDSSSIIKRIPTVFSLGSEYCLNPEFRCRVEIQKELNSSYLLSGCMDYNYNDKLQLQVGAFHLDYLVPCFGIAYRLANLLTDFQVEIHPVLGIHPSFGLKYSWLK